MKLIVGKRAVPNIMNGKSMSLLKNINSFFYNPNYLNVLYTFTDIKMVRKNPIHNGTK